ncbi:MAG: hypothetical protein BGO12_01415 [Verrucomicrobia bacterium 61-8]|nr:hypothetical protein [Verrucomicrobiota bacterium]OJU97717.1 MAG: hypothetical protein BGO12_01415 [Verrucomicrobia bacterium 61-8]
MNRLSPWSAGSQVLPLAAAVCLQLAIAFAGDAAGYDPKAFADPPASSRVETWWHWMDGKVSRDGLVRDLDSMKAQGIQRATITLVGFGSGDSSAVALGTPEFSDLVRFTAEEARKRSIQLGLTAGPGWSGAGGPWIPVEQSMKRVVFSSATVDGGRELPVTLPALPASADWARDTFVLAWPDHRPVARMSRVAQVLNAGIATSAEKLFDANPSTTVASAAARDGKTWQMAFTFPDAYPTNRAFLYLASSIWMKGQPLTIRVLADGKVVAEKEIHISDLAAPLSLPFPRVAAQTYEVQVRLPEKSSFHAGQFSLRETEFLDHGELPQWTCEFPDQGSQISDSAGALSIPADASLKPSPGSVAPGEVIDLTALRSGDTITWKAPPGRWRIVRFGYTTTNQKIQPAPPGGGGFESDKLSATATELQYRSYISPMLSAAAAASRSAFTLLMADSWESGMQNWCADFPEQFRRRRGYDLTPWMPTLAGATVGSPQETLRFFNDFRETISDLVIENYYEKLRQLAHADHLAFAAEFAFAGPRLDAFQMTRALDIPMEEIWSDWKDGNPPAIPEGTIVPTIIANAAQVAGKRIFGYELFTSLRGDWRRMPGDFSFVGDLALLKGMNQASLHTMMHQPDERAPGLTLQGFGQHFQRHNTWWTLARDWLTELGRKQYLFQNAPAFHDILVYYGDTLPRSEINLSKFALPENAQPLFIDHDALVNRVSVDAGRLQLDHRGSYACLLLPDSTMFSRGNALRVETLRKIRELVDAGATLIGQPPLRTPGLLDFRERDAELSQITASLWGPLSGDSLAPNPVGRGQVFRTLQVGKVLETQGYQPALRSTAPAGMRNLKFTRLLSEAGDVYFLFNPNDEAGAFLCDLAAPAGRIPERWNPADGSSEPLPVYSHRDGRTTVSVDIPGKSSVFLLLQTMAPPRWITASGEKSDATPFCLSGVSFRESSPGHWLATSEKATRLQLRSSDGQETSLAFAQPRILPLQDPWQLRFELLPGKPQITLAQPVSWTDLPEEKLRNYSGLVIYETSADVPESFLREAGKVLLDLGQVGRACRVAINGKTAGTLWRAPWRLPVGSLLHAGRNALTIEVVNSWYNRLMADQVLPPAERTTWTSWPRIKDWITENAPPEKSGLLMPARLVAYPVTPVSTSP